MPTRSRRQPKQEHFDSVGVRLDPHVGFCFALFAQREGTTRSELIRLLVTAAVSTKHGRRRLRELLHERRTTVAAEAAARLHADDDYWQRLREALPPGKEEQRE